MGIKGFLLEIAGWFDANGVSILVALVAVAVGGLLYWALPRGPRRKFESSDAGIMVKVARVEKDKERLKVLLRKSRGQGRYIFTKAEDRTTAAEDYKILADNIDRENAAIDSHFGVARDGEAL